MDNAIINKILKFNNKSMLHPPDNPLLDGETSFELSKSIVKILSLTSKNPESTTSKTLKNSILEYTRKLCMIDECPSAIDTPHLNFESVLNSYLNKQGHVYGSCQFLNEKNFMKFLEFYVAENMVDNSLKSIDNSPNIFDLSNAVYNLDKNNPYLLKLISKSSSSDTNTEMSCKFLKKIWMDKELSLNSDIVSQISNKLSTYLENLLLNIGIKVLAFNCDMYTAEDLWKEIRDEDLDILVKKCSMFRNVFQKCCKILNYAFIRSNFNHNFLCFFPFFISKIKYNRIEHVIYDLYEGKMSHIVSYMEKASYDEYFLTEDTNHCLADVSQSLKLLNNEDIILVLSHYPDWFDFYINYVHEDG